MKAAIYRGRGSVDLVELPVPEPGERDVVIQNLHAGVCGSDVSAYLHGPQAHRITPGSEFGHEVVSRVAAIGSAVTEFTVGQRVYPYPLLARGDTGRAGTLGGFSEYILVPDAKPGVQLHPVPDEIEDRAAALIEPFTVAFHAARQADPRDGETALVWGAGIIGIGVALGLRRLGIRRVLVADMSDFRLSKAAGLGFDTVNPSDRDVTEACRELFEDAPSLHGTTGATDIYVDAAGADALIGTFQRIGRIGARLVVVAVHAAPVEIDLASLAYASQRITGSGGYTPDDVAAVMDFLNHTDVDVTSIITHEFPLDRLTTALETAADRDHALGVAIVHEAATGAAG